jgi:hypothetical protein
MSNSPDDWRASFPVTLFARFSNSVGPACETGNCCGVLRSDYLTCS